MSKYNVFIEKNVNNTVNKKKYIYISFEGTTNTKIRLQFGLKLVTFYRHCECIKNLI